MKKSQSNIRQLLCSNEYFLKSLLLGATLLLFCGSGLFAQPNPREIVQKSRDAVRISAFESVSTLKITDRNGNERIRKSTMASKNYSDGTEKRIIKFLSPPEVRGTGMLIFDHPDRDDDMCIYLPALKRTRRIVSREKSRSFMGSEFSNADMTAPRMDDFTYSLMGVETVGLTTCWKVSAIPISTDLVEVYGFASCIMWIDRERFLTKRSWYFDSSGNHYKTIENTNYQLIDEENGRYMMMSMRAENHSNGRSSEMVLEKVALADSKDAYFSITYLEK